jgi:hypothetical protein
VIFQLAVQAATGATRSISFLALLTLQLQLSVSTDPSTDPVFNSRLARVVTKLFARVVKAEESSVAPFSSVSLDTEAVLCCLEDTMKTCDETDETATSEEAVAATRNLARALVVAMLKARGGPDSIRVEMNEVGISPLGSSLGNLVTSCTASMTFPEAAVSGTMSQDVASLVSALGSAQQGSEREEAIQALRRFKEAHGDDELNAHLQEVSGAFRAFVLEQLNGKSTKAIATDSKGASSMSERIKSLRSKLNATEVVVQSAVETAAPRETAHIDVEKAPKVRSGIPAPSPSKIPSPTKTIATGVAKEETVAVPASVKAFRERLAAAQEKRTSASTSDPDENAVAQPAAPSGGRAAALRARLQAVKRQSEQNF